MSEVRTAIEEHCSDQERELIVRSLVDYNDSRAPSENYRDLFVLSRHDEQLVGGLIGYTHWNWLFIKQLWIAEPFRRRGIGATSCLRRSRRHKDEAASTPIATLSIFKPSPFTVPLVTAYLLNSTIIPSATPAIFSTSATPVELRMNE
jgi:hypothetical protein